MKYLSFKAKFPGGVFPLFVVGGAVRKNDPEYPPMLVSKDNKFSHHIELYENELHYEGVFYEKFVERFDVTNENDDFKYRRLYRKLTFDEVYDLVVKSNNTFDVKIVETLE